MRRYRINVCILLILSVFSFALAAPVAVKEVREACTDGVDGGEIVKIGSGNLKRRFETLSQVPSSLRARSEREEEFSTPSQVQGSAEEKEPLIQTQEPSSSSSFWSTPSQVQDPVEKEPLIQTQEPSSSSSFWLTPSQVQDPVEKEPLVQTQEASSSWSTPSQVQDPVEKEPLIPTQEPSSSSSFWSTPSQVQDPVEKEPLIQTQEPPSSSSFWSTHSQVHGLSSESEQPLLSTSGGDEVPWNSLAEGEKMLSKLKVWRRISGTAGGVAEG